MQATVRITLEDPFCEEIVVELSTYSGKDDKSLEAIVAAALAKARAARDAKA